MKSTNQTIEVPEGRSASFGEASAIILPHGGYRHLIAFRKSDVIYQGTYVFCRRFLPPHGDRTVDQMVQAARSCKQNIAEGSAASGTSRKTEITLTGVACASLAELREDYLDYLEAHGGTDWPATDGRKAAMRDFCRQHADWPTYRALFQGRSAEVLCNMQLVLINQTRRLLDRLLASQEQRFCQEGGLHERMSAARKATRAQGWEQAVWNWLSAARSGAELGAREVAVMGAVRRIVAKQRQKMGW